MGKRIRAAAEASIAAKNDFAEGLEDEVERFERSFLRMREKLLRMAYQRHEVQRVTKVFTKWTNALAGAKAQRVLEATRDKLATKIKQRWVMRLSFHAWHE